MSHFFWNFKFRQISNFVINMRFVKKNFLQKLFQKFLKKLFQTFLKNFFKNLFKISSKIVSNLSPKFLQKFSFITFQMLPKMSDFLKIFKFLRKSHISSKWQISSEILSFVKIFKCHRKKSALKNCQVLIWAFWAFWNVPIR